MKRILPLAALALAACQPSVPNSAAPVDAGVGFESYESYETEVLGQTPGAPQISDEATGTQTAAAPTLNNPDLSDEQDFDAVSNRQTIESDAARLERLREEYTVIQPEALPSRPGSVGPNVVEYALSTRHPVGTQLHRRTGANQSPEALLRRCAAYVSADAAQREFLNRGGPRRDPRGLDPDGDGYACAWDPAPFRAAAR
ncbi:MAG: hypothetical protein AAF761_05865 [Pseudomonadota bacterium]